MEYVLCHLDVILYQIEHRNIVIRCKDTTGHSSLQNMNYGGFRYSVSIVTRTDEEMRNKDKSSRDSNSGSSDWQASALPTELFSRP